MIVVLAGGVGAARFLQGLVQVIPQEQLTVIVNTGDDRDFYGLHVSPDLDIVIYTLAGVVDEVHGWGIRNDTYHTMQQLTHYGNEDWFMLGDRDLATHIHRTNLLRQGKLLSEVTEQLRNYFSLQIRILPMTDNPVATHIQTPMGLLHFQEYMVKRRCADEVQDVVFVGASESKPSPGVLDAIKEAEAILIAPSNPIVSIGSILAVPGIHARYYRDFLDVMVIDKQDEHLLSKIEDLGIPAVATDTIMRDMAAKASLARKVLAVAGLE